MSPTEVVHALIQVRHSHIHGLGVFATAELPKGAVIGRYAGRRYDPDEAAARDWDHEVTYAFGLSDGTMIDGGTGGNATRHLNHSCTPNCKAYEVPGDAGRLEVEIVAKRRIRAGEELFIDYELQTDDSADSADYPCRCGTSRCRGTMVAAA